MTELMSKAMPILVLIGFGYFLQKIDYFEEVAYNRINRFLTTIIIPCMLFTTFSRMEIDSTYALVSLSIFFMLIFLLIIGFLIYKIFHIRHRFFPFLLTCFGFGTMGLPLYITLFGTDNLSYMTTIGVGHEFFAALVFLPIANIYLCGEKLSAKLVVRSVFGPTMIMVLLGVSVRFLSLNWILTDTLIGAGIAGAIENLGNLTLTLILVTVGYRLHFGSLNDIKTCFAYALIRLVVTLGFCTAYKILVIDRLMPQADLFDHAFNLLIMQHGSILILAIVGRYFPKEDHEIVNNAFVINTVIGLVLLLLYLVFKV